MTRTDWHQEQIRRCAEDPVYFINTYATILSPEQGAIRMTLYPYQEEMIRAWQENRVTMIKIFRQSGSSTVAALYALHQSLFRTDFGVAFVGVRQLTAEATLNKMRFAHECLPAFLQMKKEQDNVSRIVFENGSGALATSAGSSALRGRLCHWIHLDDWAFVSDFAAKNFIDSIFPILTATETTRITFTTCPNGENHFNRIWKELNAKRLSFTWRDHPTGNENWAKQMLENLGETRFGQEFEGKF